MVKYENHCVCCEKPRIYDACPNYSVPVYYCDRCKDDTFAVAEWDGEHFCEDCLSGELEHSFRMMSIEGMIEALGLEDEIRSV